jgi:hypothetical protein
VVDGCPFILSESVVDGCELQTLFMLCQLLVPYECYLVYVLLDVSVSSVMHVY